MSNVPCEQHSYLTRSRLMLLFLVLLLCHAVRAAPEVGTRSGFGVGVSLAYAQVRDDLVIPLRAGGPQLSFQLAYARRDVTSRLELDAKFGIAVLADRYFFLGGMLTPAVSCRYLRRVGASGDAGFLLGGQLRWEIHEELPEYWDSEHQYWLTAIDAAPAAGYLRRLGPDQQLEATLALPLAGMISRPPLHRYVKNEPNAIGFTLSQAHENLRFATLDRYQAGLLQVAWRKVLSQHDFVLAYRAALSRAAEPKPFTEIVHGVDVKWEFGK
jgi:hypothetical protein